MIDRIDSRILSFVQKWIADPLQFSGVTLERQVWMACVVAAAGWLCAACFDAADRKWWLLGMDGLVIPFAMALVVYGMSAAHRMVVVGDRTGGIFWLGMFVLGCVFLVPDPGNRREIAFKLVEGGMALRYYLLNCKPKPPVGKVIYRHAEHVA
jgi:hypothetical protein